MNASCKCGDAKHKAIIGKKASQESGEYPWALCNKYAILLMDHFEKMATAEFLEGRMKELEQFHDGLSSGDAAATEMRTKRRMEGVKLSPSLNLVPAGRSTTWTRWLQNYPNRSARNYEAKGARGRGAEAEGKAVKGANVSRGGDRRHHEGVRRDQGRRAEEGEPRRAGRTPRRRI